MNKFDSYIICATPRSGSTLLCDLLTDTALAGRPDSFFRHESFSEWARYLGVAVADWSDKHEFDLPYLAAIQKYGRNDTPVFGMRLMRESLEDLSQRLSLFYPNQRNDKDRFQSAFGSTLYLHLSRDNKIAQAVSNLRAEQSGLWHMSSDGAERERLKPGQEPFYDANRLSELVTSLKVDDASWINWFSQHQIEPLCITYETLSVSPQATLANILSTLGQDPAIAETIKPSTAKLANLESREWISRFQAEQKLGQSKRVI